MLVVAQLYIQGCNIPDVDLVAQWKLPTSVSTIVQGSGHAARGADRIGVAVRSLFMGQASPDWKEPYRCQ